MKEDKTHFTFVFDLDNTLIETNLANNKSYKEAIRQVADTDIEINPKHRFTREELSSSLKDLSKEKLSEIINLKEKLYTRYMNVSVLNKDLYTLLRILYTGGNETILLTNSRKKRANELCSYYSLSNYFSSQYFFEDSPQNKYQILSQKGYDLKHIVLFENDPIAIQAAVENGIKQENVIKVQFNK